jgi:hypothetical protein
MKIEDRVSLTFDFNVQELTAGKITPYFCDERTSMSNL